MSQTKTTSSVSMSSANSIVSYLDRKGFLSDHRKSKLFEEIGLNKTDITSLDLRLPLDRYYQLWDAALELTQDPAIGLHIGMEHHPNLMSLVANLWVHSQTSGEGLERYVEYSKILNTGMTIKLNKGTSLSELRYDYLDDEEYLRSDIERMIGLNIQRARFYLGEDMSIEKVTFCHEAPSYEGVYDEIFQCPVEFNSQYSSIVFSSDYLNRSSKPQNPYVLCALSAQAEKLQKSLLTNKTTEQVANLISKQLHMGDIQLEDVADSLHVNRQTLYRRLKSEGQNFKSLLDKIRQAKALELIKDRNLSLSEVSYYLGFSETSAFSRAFKRWTGSTPKNYRNSGAFT